MAHFAKIGTDNIVKQVIVVNNDVLMDENDVEQESLGIEFCQSLFGGTWVQTSYNKNFRKNFAGPGYKYDSVADVFIVPKPFASWVLDENHDWQPPVSMPQDDNKYIWDEDTTSWIETDLI